MKVIITNKDIQLIVSDDIPTALVEEHLKKIGFKCFSYGGCIVISPPDPAADTVSIKYVPETVTDIEEALMEES